MGMFIAGVVVAACVLGPIVIYLGGSAPNTLKNVG